MTYAAGRWGRVLRVQLFSCGMPDCTFEETIIQHKQADGIAQARRGGWSQTKEHGWICPDCTTQRKREQAARRQQKRNDPALYPSTML